MKMVKSLLLGSAAGVVAIAGAQAADLPVKAKAVEYVKICSLYGKGFYYIPGSDMCLSITGFTRFQVYSGNGGTGSAAADTQGANAPALGYQQYNNTSSPFGSANAQDVRSGFNQDMTFRTRVMMTVDGRQQTQYGTLRSVITAGFTNDAQSGGGGTGTFIYANRGFIQIAGFTFGKATSFYDFYSAPAYSYFGLAGPSDKGDGGQMVAAFTGQFGGGVSATISLEEPRRQGILNMQVSAAGAGITTNGTADYVQFRYPDVVAALRWDANWGAFQLMGGLHDASGSYYGAGFTPGVQNSGHPSDQWGWIIGAGVKFNIGADVFDVQGQYTQGALAYFNGSGVGVGGLQFKSQNVGYGLASDGVYGLNATGAQTGVDLTTAWGIVAAYDHRWSPALKSSIYGGYMAVTYNAEANAMICANAFANTATSLAMTSATTLANGNACGNNWQQWYIGSRTQWDVTRTFYVGLDVLYTKLETANAGASTNVGFTPSATGPRPAGVYTVNDQSAWIFTFRAHRDIVP